MVFTTGIAHDTECGFVCLTWKDFILPVLHHTAKCSQLFSKML